jgi:hypothetical protein
VIDNGESRFLPQRTQRAQRRVFERTNRIDVILCTEGGDAVEGVVK